MHIRHSLIAVVAVAVAVAIAGCGGSDHSASGAKRTADGLLVVPSLDKPHDPIPDPSPAGSGADPKRYLIWWERDQNSAFGYFDFVVHPTQVFLRTSVRNTISSDSVVWVQDISPDQYRAIGNFLDRRVDATLAPPNSRSGPVFTRPSDRSHEGYRLVLFKTAESVPRFTHSTDAATWEKLFDDIVNRNLAILVKELNSNLPSGVEPLFSQASIAPIDKRLKIQKTAGKPG